MLGLITGRGLLTLHGDEHQELRKVMQPAFSPWNLSARLCLP